MDIRLFQRRLLKRLTLLVNYLGIFLPGLCTVFCSIFKPRFPERQPCVCVGWWSAMTGLSVCSPSLRPESLHPLPINLSVGVGSRVQVLAVFTSALALASPLCCDSCVHGCSRRLASRVWLAWTFSGRCWACMHSQPKICSSQPWNYGPCWLARLCDKCFHRQCWWVWALPTAPNSHRGCQTSLPGPP